MTRKNSKSKEEVIRKMREILGDDYDEWVNTPNEALGFHKPIDRLGINSGEILDAILKLEYGLPS